MARIDRRSFVTLAGAAGAAGATEISAPWVARAATPIKLTLPWLPLGPYSFTFVAKAMGFWEKRGLDVTIDRGFGSGRVCVPVDQGQYDFGLIDLAVMMTCAGRGLDLVAVAGIWPVSPVGIFSLKEYNIVKPKDLEGQTVGFDVGSGDFQLWPAFVKATGIDDKKVKKVTMDGPALNTAFGRRTGESHRKLLQQPCTDPMGAGPGDEQHSVCGLRHQHVEHFRGLQTRHDRKAPGDLQELRGRSHGRTEVRIPEPGEVGRSTS
jgi:ABC-type nitrate/sulfonate/bicarbonate transport system substrate-binding protein